MEGSAPRGVSPSSRPKTASHAQRFIIASATAAPFRFLAVWRTTESCTSTWKHCPDRGSGFSQQTRRSLARSAEYFLDLPALTTPTGRWRGLFFAGCEVTELTLFALP
jgi:hypothetical protein